MNMEINIKINFCTENEHVFGPIFWPIAPKETAILPTNLVEMIQYSLQLIQAIVANDKFAFA